MIKISELKQLEIINVIDGRKLGRLKDIDIDISQGRINCFILPRCFGRNAGFINRTEDIIAVDWDDIIKIGEDVILLEAPL